MSTMKLEMTDMAVQRDTNEVFEPVAAAVRRLTVECAIAVGNALRIEVGGWERVIRPVGLEADGAGEEPTLVGSDAGSGERVRIPLGPAVGVAIDLTRLPIDRVGQDGFTVGDAVQHSSFGLGVIQSVRGGGGGALADVRFAETGKRTLVLPRAHLVRLTPEELCAAC
jgi:hypothetical protein